MRNFGLGVPQATELLFELDREGVKMPSGILDVESAFECLSMALKR